MPANPIATLPVAAAAAPEEGLVEAVDDGVTDCEAESVIVVLVALEDPELDSVVVVLASVWVMGLEEGRMLDASERARELPAELRLEISA